MDNAGQTIEVFIFYKWHEDREEADLQANLELVRALGKNFEAFLQRLVQSKGGVELASA